jgi:uncharacterized DUF497 family protein
MLYIWDEGKRESNLKKHSLDFADAKIVFESLTFTFEDDRFDYGEQRFITIGILDGKFVVLTHTEEGDDVTRIISMRKATKHEEINFFKRFKN